MAADANMITTIRALLGSTSRAKTGRGSTWTLKGSKTQSSKTTTTR